MKNEKSARNFAPDENALEKLLAERKNLEIKRTAETIDLVCFYYQKFSPIEVSRIDSADFNAMLRTIYREQNRKFREKVVAAICGFDGKTATKVLRNISRTEKNLAK